MHSCGTVFNKTWILDAVGLYPKKSTFDLPLKQQHTTGTEVNTGTVVKKWLSCILIMKYDLEMERLKRINCASEECISKE
jgi:hypothetical protein